MRRSVRVRVGCRWRYEEKWVVDGGMRRSVRVRVRVGCRWRYEEKCKGEGEGKGRL
jgi:hypothetical protein